MADRQPTEVVNLDRYGNPALPWKRPLDLLAVGSQGPEVTFFLGTVRPDGTPHAAGVGAVYFDGDLYFNSGPGTVKTRNLEAHPACTLSARMNGIDLVFEGEVERVTDEQRLANVVEVFRAGGWPAEVEGDALTAPFSAPSAGPPPWYLFRFHFHKATGVATVEPYGATRWVFGSR